MGALMAKHLRTLECTAMRDVKLLASREVCTTIFYCLRNPELSFD